MSYCFNSYSARAVCHYWPYLAYQQHHTATPEDIKRVGLTGWNAIPTTFRCYLHAKLSRLVSRQYAESGLEDGARPAAVGYITGLESGMPEWTACRTSWSTVVGLRRKTEMIAEPWCCVHRLESWSGWPRVGVFGVCERIGVFE